MYKYALLAILPTLASSDLSGQDYVPDPWPDSVETSDLGVKLVKVFRVPQSSTSDPRSRLICLREPNDGSGRIFVSDQRGQLWVSVDGNTPTLFTNLESQFPDFVDSPGLGTGFGSFDFHPDFATNRKFYTVHNESRNAATADVPLPEGGSESLQGVITEWTMANTAMNLWIGSRREILRIEITGTIHGMQEISFNKSAQPGDDDYGNLYITLGDGGSYNNGDPEQAYRLDGLMGTIMRIDPLGTNSRNGQYGIPADNPYVDGDPDTFDEIFANGFRNPHRITWDLGGNNAMLTGDIGERNFEEINLVEKGNNYGWPNREGTFLFDPTGSPGGSNNGRTNRDWVYSLPANDASFGYTYPVAQYDHFDPDGSRNGSAVCGGYVFRDPSIPSLEGQYLFGDLSSGEMFVVPVDDLVLGQPPATFEVINLYDDDDANRTYLEMVKDDSNRHSRTDLRFGQDNSGSIYAMSKRDRWVRKFVRAANDTQAPASWAGYPVASDLPDGTWVDTGSWIGWVEVTYASEAGVGWVYIFETNTWAFVDASNPSANAYWFYMQR